MVDVPNGWLYFRPLLKTPRRNISSARLDGAGKAERLSPAEQPGTHNYDISPRGDLAIHTYSAFNKVPMTDVVRLPQHSTVRTIIDNKELQERVAKLKPVAQEFFRVDIGEGVELDGGCSNLPTSIRSVTPSSFTSTANRGDRPCSTRGAEAR